MLLQLVALKRLLVLELLLSILVPLQDLGVFNFTQLQAIVHLAFELLAQGVHLVLLLLHQFGFSRKDLFVAGFHMLLSLLLLHLVGTLLNLMSLLVILLFGQVLLDFAQVKQLS